MKLGEKWNRNKIFWLAAAVLLVLAPVILMCLRSLQIGMNCFKLHPVWSDEMVYWRETYNFIHTGIKGGYTGANDLAPRLANFGTHSFMNTLVYAAFAMLFGWHDNSIMIYNLLFLILCLLVFVWWLKPEKTKLIWLTASMICYLPLYYYLPTSMTEVLNYGGILLYTAALLRYYQKHEEKWFLAAFLATVFLCFYKLPNMVFFIPLVLAVFSGRITKKFCLHTVGCIVSAVVIYVVNSAFTAPYPWFFSEVFEEETVGKMISKVWGRFTENLQNYVSLSYGTGMERMQRYFFLLMLAVLFLAIVWHILRERKQSSLLLAVSYFLMLAASFVLINAFYEVWDWRDYRMMAPVAWSALIMLILRFPVRYVLAPAVAALLMFGYEFVKPNQVFISWERTVPIETPEICEYIEFDENAADGFDNTLALEYVNLEIYCRLAPGIGVQNIFTPEAITRSKYILVEDTEYDFPGYHLEKEGDFGRLYVRD
ncbi:MAG: hypothetical protein GX234_06550 [Clostridiales bacterium]|mgnify:CR=1 FL=1|nr:hypothetical protein [Clostridiales bacterium]